MLNDPAMLVQIRPHKPRPKRETDARHLAFVRTLPCCICHRPGFTEAHHLLRGVTRGMGLKSADRWALPLCDVHHAGLHAHGDETEFLALRGINGPALAAALYSVSGDYQRAMEVLR